jgi:quercetin dioxygenase-like cupin family protein
MNIYDARSAADGAISTQPDRPATTLLHDAPDARLVCFRIAAGQAVPAHSNPSTVILTVLSGSGFVLGAEGERAVRTGDVAVYEPDETHAMRATSDELVLLATIAPRPGTR